VVDGEEGSVTRSTSTQARISDDEILFIISTIEVVCKMLLALIPILKKFLKK